MMTNGTTPSLVERVAQVAHEANRTWDSVRGVTPGPPWDQAQEWQRAAAIKGVRLALAGAPASQLHEAWRATKQSQGWQTGPVKDLEARTDPMLVPYTELSQEDKRTPDLIAAIARTLGCGHERWAVKTLTDPEASQVNMTPQLATVGDLVDLPAPWEPTSRVAQEFNSYQVSGTITVAKQEADSDIHMVLQDGDGRTMIVEATCPDCAQNSSVAAQISTVRQAVETHFPTAASGGREDASLVVTVTGIAFFDHLHGQEGVAPNGLELHPVLSLVVDGAAPSPAPGGAPPTSLQGGAPLA